MKKNYTIGRDSQCDIVIHDPTNVVSRLHASLRLEPNGKIFLRDESRNGTYVNGIRMAPNVDVPVSRNDSVSFANVMDLDWTQIPNVVGRRIRNFLLVTAVIVVTGLCCWLVMGTDCLGLKSPDTIIQRDTIFKNDTIIRRDTVIRREIVPMFEIQIKLE